MQIASESGNLLNYTVFIPARGGSKGIPQKNLQKVGGIPLIQRTILTAKRAAQKLDNAVHIVVSTDSDAIADCALEIAGTSIHKRPENLASDSSVLEDALFHFFEQNSQKSNFHNDSAVAVLQCTSPFILPDEILAGFSMIASYEFASAFIGLKNHYWLYSEETGGNWKPIGHDLGVRPPRQMLKAQAHEIGAGYFFRQSGFLESGFRLHGRVGLVEASLLTAVDIDEPEDLIFCQRIAESGASDFL